MEEIILQLANDLIKNAEVNYTFNHGQFFGNGTNYKGLSYKHFTFKGYPELVEVQLTIARGLIWADLEVYVVIKPKIDMPELKYKYLIKNFSKKVFYQAYDGFHLKRHNIEQERILKAKEDNELLLKKALELQDYV